MIPRYSRKEMTQVWTDEARFLRWMEVELAVTREWVRRRRVPAKEGARILQAGQRILKSGLSVREIEKEEKELRHDVLAFTTVVARRIGPAGRYFHFGMTSSDIVDTALMLAIQRSGGMIVQDLKRLEDVLLRRARETLDLVTIGRTHGMFAEPSSFGLKFLSFHQEIVRNRERFVRALEGCRFGKLSGAVGVNAHLPPAAEERALKELGLTREPVSTQVIPRDRIAELFSVFSLIGGAMERLTLELRHLQRSEVDEVQEAFGTRQKGSSAMPHKKNPISSENLTGVARMLRSYVVAAHENIALWHERDISHSSVERVFLPDAFILADYALDRLAGLIEGLLIHRERVHGNLKRAGDAVFSGHLLLRLVERGALRESAYRWVQGIAFEAKAHESSWLELALGHPEVRKFLSEREIRDSLSPKHAIRHAREIFQKATRERAAR